RCQSERGQIGVVGGVRGVGLDQRAQQRDGAVGVVGDLDDPGELRIVDVRGGVDLPEALLGGLPAVGDYPVVVGVPVDPAQHVGEPVQKVDQFGAGVPRLGRVLRIGDQHVHGVGGVVAEQQEQLVGVPAGMRPAVGAVVAARAGGEHLLDPVQLTTAQ